MRTSVIIVAAGTGTRLGGATPKQFLPCAGRPLVAHAILRFSRVEGIEAIVVALPQVEDLERHLGGAGQWPVPVVAVAGGDHRQASVAAGLKAVGDTDIVLVHDGARPLVPPALIRSVRQAASMVGAAVACVPCRDTIKEVAGGRVRTTRDRGELWLAQTPQGFRVDLLRRAHARAAAEGFRGTDDAALVEKLGAPVAVVESPSTNIKVTTADDLALAEALLASGVERESEVRR